MNGALLLCRQNALGRMLSVNLNNMGIFDCLQVVNSEREALVALSLREYRIIMLVASTYKIAVCSFIARIRTEHGDMLIVVFRNDTSDDIAASYYRAGANGVFSLAVRRASLERALRAMLDGHTLIANSMLLGIAGGVNAVALTETLSPDDLTILRMVMCGLSNKEIALSMFYNENTIKYRVSALMRRFNALNRIHLAAITAHSGVQAHELGEQPCKEI